MMEDEPRRRSSSDTRHALTVALSEARPRRLLEPRHKLVQGMLYTRFVIGEETLSSTRAFNFSHWAILHVQSF
jgi:hypothetical protein